MVENISEEEIRKVISQVKHPAIDRTLFDLGIVKDVVIEDKKVRVTLALPFPGIPILDDLVNSLREPIERLGGEFEAKLTVMNQEELQKFLAMEQEGWRGSM